MFKQFSRTLISTGVLIALAGFSSIASADDPMLGSGGYARQLHTMGMMKMLDGNGDHMVSHDEFVTYYGSIFDELDTDKDGTIDAKEWVGTKGNNKISIATGGYSSELRTMKVMGMMDTTGDHKITKEEFLAFHEKLFQGMDKKGDGMVDAQEWLAKTTGH